MPERVGTELGAFLRAMRSRLEPAEVGLPGTGRRRVPGLRRQEVAQLACVSVDWYIRLEQGRASAPGSAVLDAIAEALCLSAAECTHLRMIARGEIAPPRAVSGAVRDSLRTILAGMPLLPAYVIDCRFDVLARNGAAAALFGEDFGRGAADNVARLLFLDPQSRSTQLSWKRIARETAGNLRVNLARYPDDVRLHEIIDELRSASPEFGALWSDHTIEERARGVKQIRHPGVGDLTVRYDALAAPDGTDQRMMILTPADTASEAALRVLITARADVLGGARLRRPPVDATG